MNAVIYAAAVWVSAVVVVGFSVMVSGAGE